MPPGPGAPPANGANFFFISAGTAVSPLIRSCLAGGPLTAAGAVAVLVPGVGAPVIRARSGCPPPGSAAPACADGRASAAISPTPVIGRVRLSSPLRMNVLLPAPMGQRPCRQRGQRESHPPPDDSTPSPRP